MDENEQGRAVLWVRPWDPKEHRRRTKGASGVCSWLCAEPAVWSVQVRELAGGVSTFALCERHRRRVEDVYGGDPT